MRCCVDWESGGSRRVSGDHLGEALSGAGDIAVSPSRMTNRTREGGFRSVEESPVDRDRSMARRAVESCQGGSLP